MSFIENLIQSIKEKKSVVCMGLDPRLEHDDQIPRYLKEEFGSPDKSILEFNKQLIESTQDIIPVIKPQIAFYEKYDALRALKETINYAHKNDLLVILDSKRNDIGSTSEAYADSTFKVYSADACTLNGYLGFDSIKPYLESYPNKGLFILVKTSNPSSDDFQNLFSVRLDNISNEKTNIEIKEVKLERNYVHMAKLVQVWAKHITGISEFTNLGVVVGATFPSELQQIRKIVPSSFILLPGYGAQGAQAKDIKFGFNEKGLGGIVNSSRGIIFAHAKNKRYKAEMFAKAARDEIVEMNKQINKEINLL